MKRLGAIVSDTVNLGSFPACAGSRSSRHPTTGSSRPPEGDAGIRPSGDHAMRPIQPVCPRSVRTSFTPGGRFFRTSSSACSGEVDGFPGFGLAMPRIPQHRPRDVNPRRCSIAMPGWVPHAASPAARVENGCAVYPGMVQVLTALRGPRSPALFSQARTQWAGLPANFPGELRSFAVQENGLAPYPSKARGRP